MQMRGTTWELVPGVDGQHVPVDIDETGAVKRDEDDETLYDPIDDEEPTDVQPKTTYDRLHISKKAALKYGFIEGCPACKLIARQSTISGGIGQHLACACRARIIEKMKDDPDYRRLIQKHERQQEDLNVEAVVRGEAEEFSRSWAKKAIYNIQQKLIRERGNVSEQLDATMRQLLINNIEVAEADRPPTASEMARKMGLRAGWILDITTVDHDGRAWDINEAEMRNRAARQLLKDEPLLLIGSPMCTGFRVMNNLNYRKMCPEEVERRMEYGKRQLEFCAKLYTTQWRAGQ